MGVFLTDMLAVIQACLHFSCQLSQIFPNQEINVALRVFEANTKHQPRTKNTDIVCIDISG